MYLEIHFCFSPLSGLLLWEIFLYCPSQSARKILSRINIVSYASTRLSLMSKLFIRKKTYLLGSFIMQSYLFFSTEDVKLHLVIRIWLPFFILKMFYFSFPEILYLNEKIKSLNINTCCYSNRKWSLCSTKWHAFSAHQIGKRYHWDLAYQDMLIF